MVVASAGSREPALLEEFIDAFGVWEEARPYLHLIASGDEMRLVLALCERPATTEEVAGRLGMPVEEAVALLRRAYLRCVVDRVEQEGQVGWSPGTFHGRLDHFAKYENWDDIPAGDRRAIDRRTQVLSVSHVEFGSGYRNDVAALAEAVHAVDGLLCVDAIQSVGALRVDVNALGIDVLATGGYKWLCGPLGSGFAYVSPRWRDTLEPAVVDFGHLAPTEREAVWNALVCGAEYPMGRAPIPADGTRYEVEGLSPLLFKGLNASLSLFLEMGAEAIEARISELVDDLIERLRRARVEILSPADPAVRSGIVTVKVPFDLTQTEEVRRLEDRLRTAQIVAHPRGGGLRFAVHFFNTPEDLDAAVAFVAELWREAASA